jgi:hypothetical protein
MLPNPTGKAAVLACRPHNSSSKECLPGRPHVAKRLFFPTPDTKVDDSTFMAKFSGKKCREVSIQCSFQSVEAYFQNMAAAVSEELQIVLLNLAEKHWSAFRSIHSTMPVTKAISSLHKNAPAIRSQDFPALFKKKQLELFVDTSLEWAISSKKRKPQRGYDDLEDHAEEDEQHKQQPEETKFYLKFKKDSVDNTLKKKWSVGDLWIVCLGNELIDPCTASCGHSDSIYILKSVWRSPSSKDGSLLVDLVGMDKASVRSMTQELLSKGRRSEDGPFGPKKCIRTLALRGTENHCMLVDVLKYCTESFLTDSTLTSFPLLRSILSGSKNGVSETKSSKIVFPFQLQLTLEEIDGVTKDIRAQFKLNCDQNEVLQNCAKWFTSSEVKKTSHVARTAVGSANPHPIVLVHGVFGAGKSTLLVAICFLVDALMHAHDAKCVKFDIKKRLEGADIRILLASSTNKAVDNVMRSLLDHDFNAIARCGHLDKISGLVKAFHVQQNVFTGKKCTMSVSSKSEDDNGTSGRKSPTLSGQQLFNRARVVGTTCAAANGILKEGTDAIDHFGTFPIVLFDESSQIIEPFGLVPLRLAKCSALVSVGDPKQLPPTLNGNEKPLSSERGERAHGLECTMFERLKECGVAPIMLRTQYRCPNFLANIASTMFYGGALINGKKKSSMAALPGLPRLAVVNVQCGSEEHGLEGGWKNVVEAKSIAETAYLLVTKANISPSSIGVISMFKDQVRTVSIFYSLISSFSAHKNL